MQKHNVEEITGLHLGVISPEQIRDQSAVEILTHETWDSNSPKIGGLFDPRLGVSEHGRLCATCRQRNDCLWSFWTFRACSKGILDPIFTNGNEIIEMCLLDLLQYSYQ